MTLRILGRVAALMLAWQGAAQAATYIETVDAGQILSGAALVTIANPTQISGNIFAVDDADLFAIQLTAGTPFTAQTSSAGFASGGIEDTQLFLFNAAGQGVRYNDDIEVTNFFSKITFTPSVSGAYYLGVSAIGNNPLGSGGSFMYVRNPLDSTQVAGPSLAGALGSWAPDGSNFTDSGTYDIALTGAAPVPEPGTYALLSLGLATLFGLRRRIKD